jgi:hypothetical protein
VAIDPSDRSRRFLDASFFRMHPGSPAEPVLAAWGITTEGKPAFIGLAPAPPSPPTPGTTFSPTSRTGGLASPRWSLATGAGPARRDRADEHHHRIRHSNFIERTFGETRRQVKVIGRLPARPPPHPAWAVLDRGWRGLTMTSDGLRLLQDLRRSLLQPPRQPRPPTVTPAHPRGASML